MDDRRFPKLAKALAGARRLEIYQKVSTASVEGAWLRPPKAKSRE